MAGVAAGLRELWPTTELIACSPLASPVMVRSIEAGQILNMDSEPTWSDGTAGGLEANTITFPLCQEFISRSILVGEDAILDALGLLLEDLGVLVEGAAGVAAAACIADDRREPGDRVGVIVCGGNSSKELESAMAARGANKSRSTH